MSKRGRPALGESKRTVKVSAFLTLAEAARVDAERGDKSRAVWMREAALTRARKVEAGRARAAKVARDAVVVGAWETQTYGKCRDFASGHLAAFVDGRGWEAYDKTEGRIDMGHETGPEGQRLADAALRAAGYVLGGSTP